MNVCFFNNMGKDIMYLIFEEFLNKYLRLYLNISMTYKLAFECKANIDSVRLMWKHLRIKD